MKRFVAIILALGLALSLVACGTPASSAGSAPSGGGSSAVDAAGPVTGGTISIPVSDDPTTLLGWMMRNSNEGVVAPVIYEFLFQYDETGEPQPYLIESYEADVEGLTYTFHVRSGVTFQDGTPLNAESVKWNLDNYKANGILTESYFSKVDSVEATDDMTVVVKFNEWDSMFLYALARTCYICSPTAVEQLGQDGFNETPVGTGPFKVAKWVHGEGIYTERYDAYWQGTPYLDGVNVMVYATTATQQAALEAGDLDVMYIWGDATTADALEAKGFTITNSAIPQSAYTMCYNSRAAGPLTDVRVRQAISYAVDAEAICAALLGNGKYGEASTQWAFSDSAQYTPIEGYNFDVEKAKTLLKDAGYEKGFDLSITYQTGDFARNACQIIAEELSAIGINLTLNEVEVANYVNYLGEWDGILLHPMGTQNGQFSQVAANMIAGARFGSECFLHDEESQKLIINAGVSDYETAAKDLKRVVEILFQENCEMYTVAIQRGTAVINPNLKDSGLNDVLANRGTFWSAYLAA